MRELLGSAKPSRPLDDATFRRGAARVATFSVAPAAAVAVSVWAKLAVAGVIGLATAATIVGTDMLRSHDASRHTRALSTPPPPMTEAAVAPTVVATVSADDTNPPNEPSGPLARPVSPPPPAAKAVARPPLAVMPSPTAAVEPAIPWVPDERPKSTLAGELELLETARGHLARSPETALAKLAEHRARYPSGLLANERDLMELDALRKTGRVEDARSRAQAWLARDPRGMHAARVRQILSTLN
jgi:hypothetical protein